MNYLAAFGLFMACLFLYLWVCEKVKYMALERKLGELSDRLGARTATIKEGEFKINNN